MSTNTIQLPNEKYAPFCCTWHNQHNSEMDLMIHSDGWLTGTFRTEAGEEFPLVGFVAGDVIGFSVSFGKHHCVTCWNGHMNADGNLDTLWQMSIDVGDQEDCLWKSTFSGADLYTKGPKAAKLHLLKTAPSHPTWLASEKRNSS